MGLAKEKPGQHWRKETVAEFGAAILCECLGVEYALNWSYRYLEQYAKAVEKTPAQAAMETVDRICKCVDSILTEAGNLQQTALVAV